MQSASQLDTGGDDIHIHDASGRSDMIGSLCLTVMFALYAVWVPLMPDEFTTASMIEAGRARIAAGKEAKAG